MTHVPPFVRLRPRFDAAKLQAELHAAEAFDRQRQPGQYHSGEWQGISLRAPGGRGGAYPGFISYAPYRACEALAAMPHLRFVLSRIPGPKLGARLLYLPPGGEIREHRDDLLGLWHGIVRLHVPIATDPRVEFRIDGAVCPMAPGELWYGDFARPHSVSNRWSETRVHLVVDTVVTRELFTIFPDSFVDLDRDVVTCTPRACSLPPRDLARFVTDLEIPPALIAAFLPMLVIGMDPSRRRAMERHAANGLMVAISHQNGRLFACTTRERLARLQPIDARTLKIADWSAGIVLHFTFDRRGRPARVQLELRLPPAPPKSDNLRGQMIDLHVRRRTS